MLRVNASALHNVALADSECHLCTVPGKNQQMSILWAYLDLLLCAAFARLKQFLPSMRAPHHPEAGTNVLIK
jgi:hypothetical protein